jgi:hypothetical protein
MGLELWPARFELLRMSSLSLAVVNPRGNDPEQHFPDGAGTPDERAHPPVNYHAYAACTAGSFFRREEAIPAGKKAVLLLLRQDLKACRQAMIELRAAGKVVAVSFKESGALQVAELLRKPAKLKLFFEICSRARGAIASTEELVPLYRAAGMRMVEFIPTPYPVEDARWDFSAPIEERRGILVGTREFNVPSRNHLLSLLALRPFAEAMGEAVTVINADGWQGRRMLARLGYPEGLLRVVEGRLPYPRYLRLMARHKLVFQLDASAVPGQVAGDALLCRVPCVGGNGAIERLVFPDLCGHGRTPEQLCEAAVERAVEAARYRAGFAQGARALSEFFRGIGG